MCRNSFSDKFQHLKVLTTQTTHHRQHSRNENTSILSFVYIHKRSLADKLRFLNIAQGSLEECRYYLILIQDLQYAPTQDLTLLLEEVSKILEAYSNTIEQKRKS